MVEVDLLLIVVFRLFVVQGFERDGYFYYLVFWMVGYFGVLFIILVGGNVVVIVDEAFLVYIQGCDSEMKIIDFILKGINIDCEFIGRAKFEILVQGGDDVIFLWLMNDCIYIECCFIEGDVDFCI